jgi:hypothetical protein
VNARDAMPQGGKLTIAVTKVTFDEAHAHPQGRVRPGPHAMLTITDTAPDTRWQVTGPRVEPFCTTKPATGAPTRPGDRVRHRRALREGTSSSTASPACTSFRFVCRWRKDSRPRRVRRPRRRRPMEARNHSARRGRRRGARPDARGAEGRAIGARGRSGEAPRSPPARMDRSAGDRHW